MANFNWDALDIGNCDLEHSQNFFDFRHIEHERLNEQNEEFLDKIIPRSKPIAVFKGKRLLDEFKSCDDQKEKLTQGKMKDEGKRLENVLHLKFSYKILFYSKPKPSNPKTNPVKGKIEPPRPPTIPRTSRLTQYAETYAEKRKAMIERYQKEQEEKNKPRKFRARSLPKFLKAQRERKRSSNEGSNKENVQCDKPAKDLVKKRPKLRKSRSAMDFN